MDRVIRIPPDRGVDRAAKDVYVDRFLQGYPPPHDRGEILFIVIKAIGVDAVFH
jgi:hypothetical protein